jgi:hypothetical protein
MMDYGYEKNAAQVDGNPSFPLNTSLTIVVRFNTIYFTSILVNFIDF